MCLFYLFLSRIFCRDNHQREETNGKQRETGSALVWLELNKDAKMAQFTIDISGTERSTVLSEDQGKITYLTANCLIAVYKANHRNRRYLLSFTQRQAVFRLGNKGSDQRTITVIVRKIICFLWPPRRGNSRQTTIVYSEGICSNY